MEDGQLASAAWGDARRHELCHLRTSGSHQQGTDVPAPHARHCPGSRRRLGAVSEMDGWMQPVSWQRGGAAPGWLTAERPETARLVERRQSPNHKIGRQRVSDHSLLLLMQKKTGCMRRICPDSRFKINKKDLSSHWVVKRCGLLPQHAAEGRDVQRGPKGMEGRSAAAQQHVGKGHSFHCLLGTPPSVFLVLHKSVACPGDAGSRSWVCFWLGGVFTAGSSRRHSHKS